MSEYGEKYWSVFSKSQADVLQCLVLSTTKRRWDYCRRGLKKAENIQIWEAEFREFGHFFLRKWQKRKSCRWIQ